MVRYGSFTPHVSIHTSCSSADHMKLLPAEIGTCLTLEAGVLLQKLIEEFHGTSGKGLGKLSFSSRGHQAITQRVNRKN